MAGTWHIDNISLSATDESFYAASGTITIYADGRFALTEGSFSAVGMCNNAHSHQNYEVVTDELVIFSYSDLSTSTRVSEYSIDKIVVSGTGQSCGQAFVELTSILTRVGSTQETGVNSSNGLSAEAIAGTWLISNIALLSRDEDFFAQNGKVSIDSSGIFKLIEGSFGAAGMCNNAHNNQTYQMIGDSLIIFNYAQYRTTVHLVESEPNQIVLTGIGVSCGVAGVVRTSVLIREASVSPPVLPEANPGQLLPNPIPAEPNRIGLAILIAGGGAQPSNTLFPYSNDFTQRMYRLLRMRGYTDEEIIYLNPHAPDIEPLDGYQEDDKQDFELFDPESEINLAFAQAASRLLAGQQFLLYVHGHARADYLDIRPPYELSAQYLRELLDTLPAGVEQIIILDTCFSGSFVKTLAAPGRIVLSSSDDVSYAWNSKYISFSDLLIRSLLRGQSIAEVFYPIHQELTGLSGNYQPQTPWLDDNGDGIFSSQDGVRSTNVCLGSCGVAGKQIPEILQFQSTQEISDGRALLWASVNQPPEVIRQVRAILRGPDAAGGNYQGQNTAFGRIEAILPYNADENRYEATYDRFYTSGVWDLFYQAQGADGAWSDMKKGQLRQTQTPDSPQYQTNASVTILLNQFEYRAGDDFVLDMQVDGQQTVTPYVAIIFPDGNFITYSYRLGFSFTNALYPYRDTLTLNGTRTYPILSFPMPPGLTGGEYQACGALVKPQTQDALNTENWLSVSCTVFGL
ncbi:MAG: hypothetical protein GY862_19990 [Gammaproteobacteria bacterium]|nr:hypothetical protein [Gammaproteobacteria bacterium]